MSVQREARITITTHAARSLRQRDVLVLQLPVCLSVDTMSQHTAAESVRHGVMVIVEVPCCDIAARVIESRLNKFDCQCLRQLTIKGWIGCQSCQLLKHSNNIVYYYYYYSMACWSRGISIRPDHNPNTTPLAYTRNMYRVLATPFLGA